MQEAKTNRGNLNGNLVPGCVLVWLIGMSACQTQERVHCALLDEVASHRLGVVRVGMYDQLEVLRFETHGSLVDTPHRQFDGLSCGVSANGQYLIVAARRRLASPTGYLDAIEVRDVKGGVRTDFRTNALYLQIRSAELAHNGGRVAFVGRSDRSSYGIQIVSSGEPEIRTLYSVEGPDGLPNSISWSPDDSHLVFDHKQLVMVLDLDTTRARPIVAGTSPAWVDASWISYRGLDGILRFISPGGEQIREPFGQLRVDLGMRWSPNAAFGLYKSSNTGELTVIRRADGARCPIARPIGPDNERLLRWVVE